MKITTKVIALALLTTTIGAAAIVPAQAVMADQQTTNSASNNNTSTLTSSYVVYGAGAPQSVYTDLNDTMDVDSNFKKLTATADDYRQYIGSDNTTNAAMISSVAITPTDPGSGVKVNIRKYNGKSNITKVTAQQYAMVAQMAGVTDITINVTANRPVSGESALTGVYKAFAADGHRLNPQNTSAANSVMDATQDAIDANSNDKNYAGKLMAAVGDVSKQIAQKKQNNNDLATKQDIQNMLDRALKSRGIDDQTTKSQQNKIVNSLVTFQNSPISSSKLYVNNVSNTINNVKNSSGNLMNKAKEWANSDSAKKAEQQASGWFQKFIAWIQSFFN